MILYLATPTTIFSYDKERALTKGVYILETYHAIRKKKDLEWIDPQYFLLDSGAYTYMRGNGGHKTIDWDKYIEEYAEFILRNKVQRFFELDIDKLIGYPAVKKLTARLEKLTGLQSIPVWHRSRGLKAWEEMIEQYKYISLSASGNNGSSEWTSTPDGIRAMRQLNDMARSRGVKVHALGYTKLDIVRQVQFYSVDSTAWTFSVRSGNVHFFHQGEIKKVKKPAGSKMAVGPTYTASYKAWTKMQKHLLLKTDLS